VAERHRLTRQRFARLLAEQPPATVVMEAWGMAHPWGREAQARGHQVRLLPPRDVRPYVRGNETDRSDATGLLEANRNESIRPVLLKGVEQHALAGLQRMRSARPELECQRLPEVDWKALWLVSFSDEMDSSRDLRGIECQSRLAPRNAPGRRSPRCILRRSQWILPSRCSRSRCRSGRGR
jgi:hypothetical protein